MCIDSIISSARKKKLLTPSSAEWYIRRAYKIGVREGSLPHPSGMINCECSKENEETIKRIMDAVCSVFEITKEQLCSKTRKRNIVDARRVFIYFYYPTVRSQLIVASALRVIGRSTVANHQETFYDLYENDRYFHTKVNQVKAILTPIN